MINVIVYSDGSGNTFDSDGGYGFRMLIDGETVKLVGDFGSMKINGCGK